MRTIRLVFWLLFISAVALAAAAHAAPRLIPAPSVCVPTSNIVEGLIDFGPCTLASDNCYNASLTLVAPLGATVPSCLLHTGTPDHPAGDEDVVVEGITYTVDYTTTPNNIVIAANAPNESWGTYVVTCYY